MTWLVYKLTHVQVDLYSLKKKSNVLSSKHATRFIFIWAFRNHVKTNGNFGCEWITISSKSEIVLRDCHRKKLIISTYFLPMALCGHLFSSGQSSFSTTTQILWFFSLQKLGWKLKFSTISCCNQAQLTIKQNFRSC